MIEFDETTAGLSGEKRALLALRRMRAKLEAEERRRREPIAIVGMGCRFPGGATDPERFWALLEAGGDAITEIPRERWDVDALYDPEPEAPGKMATRWGGFLEHVDQFDPQFFGIAPREAMALDPQKRLLLAVAWAALEDAGQTRERLAGSPTSVFVGVCNADWARAMSATAAALDTYTGTGSSLTLLSV